MNEAMADLMADVASVTGAGSFDELEKYYQTGHWKRDDLTADNIANDVVSILKTIREHAELHKQEDV